MNITMTEPEQTTALTAPQRAALALSSAQTRTDLAELVAKSANILEVKNTAGRDDCHGAAMALVKARTTIEKTGKAAREDATAFSKAVIAEEKSLVAITAAEEARLLALRNTWDEARAAERAEAERIERERITKIHLRLADIRAVVGLANMAKLPECADLLSQLAAYVVAGFEEFEDEAATVLAETIATVTGIHDTKAAEEAERARVAAEQKAERQRLAAERAELARLQAEAKALRDAEDAAMAEMRAAFMAEISAADKAQQEARAAMAAQQAAFDAEQAAARAKSAAVIAAVTVVDEVPALLPQAANEPERSPLALVAEVNRPNRPTDVQIVEAIAAAFSVATPHALQWLVDFDVDGTIEHYEGVAA